MKNKNYSDELKSLLIKEFIPAGYRITKDIELDSSPESAKYQALVFGLNEKNIVYRKGKVTPDRPGAYLTVWQRPPSSTFNRNKPIPLTSNDLDYLFVEVKEHSNITSSEESMNSPKYGIFVFPISLLIKKGIVSSINGKGKTGFRVFPPWSQDRGVVGTKVFSESGKRTQRWQLPYFIDIDENGIIAPEKLHHVFNHK